MFHVAPFSTDDLRVGNLAEALALRNGTDPVTAGLIKKAAELHDVGKFKIPESILRKPDKLSADEFEIVKTHTFLGASMLKEMRGDLGVMARNICNWHHERYDKRGYWLESLDDLPPYIPMVTICDVYIAVTSPNRPYKAAWSHNQALSYIESQAGKQFCPKLAKIFLALMADNPTLRCNDGGIVQS